MKKVSWADLVEEHQGEKVKDRAVLLLVISFLLLLLRAVASTLHDMCSIFVFFFAWGFLTNYQFPVSIYSLLLIIKVPYDPRMGRQTNGLNYKSFDKEIVRKLSH